MKRIQSVEVLRVLSIIAVISLHTTPLESIKGNSAAIHLGTLISQSARFAVPFFFVISGYFFAIKVKKEGQITPIMLATIKRLSLIWLFFTTIYIFPYDLSSAFEHGLYGPIKAIYWNVLRIKNDPVLFIFQGTQAHLWFLISLIHAVLITSIFLRYWKSNPLHFLVTFSITLYIIGLLAKAYSDTPFGINISFNTRNGPFFGTIFFVMGYILSYLNIQKKHFAYGILSIFIGYIISFSEIYYLYFTYNTVPCDHDYVIGTLFVGLGVALVALSNHPILQIQFISKLGKYTLGIYGIHFIFVALLKYYDRQTSSPIWEITYIFIVFALSVGSTLILSRYKLLRHIFT